MNSILQNLDPSIMNALGWTIIHSFWQASLIALTMSLVHRFGKSKSANFKYGVSVISMLGVFVCSAITFGIYYGSTPNSIESTEALSIVTVSIDGTIQQSFLDNLNLFFIDNLDRINLIWSVGVLLFLLRFIISFLYTRYLKITAIHGQDELGQVLSKIKTRLQIDKAISIAESSYINVPLVLGHFKPLILFPIGMVNALKTEEVEAIITHELAHIKRFDYLINVLMTLLETLFYFHPAVWWISANIKAERENCCDDFALAHQIDKVVYAKALVKLEEIKSGGIPSLAMPFSSKRHQLLNRIKRIMNMPQTKNDMKEKSIATVLLLSMVLLFNTQVNSKPANTFQYSEHEKTAETLRLKGEEEMVLTVKDGKFESLKVDNEIQDGEIIDKVASTVNKNSQGNNSYTMTVKEGPVLTIVEDKVNIKGNGGVVYERDDNFNGTSLKADTLPRGEWDESTSLVFEDDENVTIITNVDGKVIEIERVNGEVVKLVIDDKVIPKSEYGKYAKEIESASKVQRFDGDFNIFKDFDGKDFSKSFGFMFDGENWREFGGNFNQLFDEEMMEKLKNMEDMEFEFRGLENLEELEKLGESRGMERLREMEGFERMGDMENLEEIFKELGITLDSAFGGMNFKFDNFDGFKGLNNFRFFDGNDFDMRENELFRGESNYRSGTVVEKIGSMLNKDGLLKEYKSNKVEITGKHLKINGEKMPKALYEKYKRIYQETTGAPLTKGSKMVFDVEGKPSKRKVKTF